MKLPCYVNFWLINVRYNYSNQVGMLCRYHVMKLWLRKKMFRDAVKPVNIFGIEL
jgi:hypothetical protein